MRDCQAGKVALFLPSLGGGGAERAMLNVATGLAQRGLSVDMVLVKAEGQYIDLVPEYVRLVDLRSDRIAVELAEASALSVAGAAGSGAVHACGGERGRPDGEAAVAWALSLGGAAGEVRSSMGSGGARSRSSSCCGH